MYAGFRLWTQRGIFEHIFTALREDADMEQIPHSAKCIRVPMVEKKTEYQAVGVSNGGRNTKLHTIADGPRACLET